jgi:fatty-acyl-CoA synthase
MLEHGLGIGPGDRVAYLGLNSPENLDLVFACARLGAMLLPLNWRLAAPEHLYILRNGEPAALLAEPGYCDHIDSIRGELGEMAFVRYGGTTPGWLDYHALLEAANGEESTRSGDLDRPHLLVYTSGTTGRPKGAVLSQSAVFWNAINAVHAHDMTSADNILNYLPMFHVGGLNVQTLPAFHSGATVTLQPQFDPGAVLRAIAEERPTLVVLVPAVIQALAAHPDWAATDLSSLRLICAGSTIIPVPLIELLHGRGVPVIQLYGSTETAPGAIYLRRADAERKIGSAGKPALHCDCRIVDDQGRDVAQGERGEILVRGPNLFDGYWRDEAATAAALRDGWYHSGDVGYQDDEGYYWIVERKKDVIISGGENIYPAEIEAVLAESPAISEAAVVARPDQKWGEVPVAIVVIGGGAEGGKPADAKKILSLFEGRLARYKHPREVIFVDALPRNVMGKVLKFELREMVAKIVAKRTDG